MTVMRIPIYPSQEVVFPGQLFILPLKNKVLELMVQFCREHHRPLGIARIADGSEHKVARVGSVVRILGMAQNDAVPRPNVAIVGRTRFRMTQMHYDQPYMEATVKLWPWVSNPRPSWMMVEQLGEYLRRYIEVFSEILPPALLPEALLPDAASLGVLGAALLQLPSVDKQHLLEIPSTHELLAEVLRYMRIYVPIAERLAEMPPPVLEEYERISLN